MKTALTIATRQSPLALWQAEHIKHRLQQLHPGLEVSLLGMTTQGDAILDSPLSKVGGKGLFVKELEHALLDGRADIAVHSMKDVPAEFPAGLALPVICQREDPYDAFVSNRYAQLDDLPIGAVVGTSSLRRQCQISALRPDLKILSLRGNVNTRLAKLDNNDYDAIILACAGLRRLQMSERIRSVVSAEQLLPAVGQGALGIECRAEDAETQALIAPLAHSVTQACVSAERAMNRRLEGGCQVPIAGFAVVEDDRLQLRGLVGREDGQQILRSQTQGPLTDAESLGQQVADALLAQGAGEILRQVYGQ